MIVKHKRNMDVAYQLFNDNPQAMIINMGYTRSFYLNTFCEINLDSLNKQDWEVCEDEKLECIRYSKWRPLSER